MINSQEGVAGRLGAVSRAGCCEMQVRAASCRSSVLGQLCSLTPGRIAEHVP